MSARNWDAGQLLGTSGQFWETCTLHAGVALEVFTVLDDKQLTAEEVARETEADCRALTMLLNALAAMGLLAKTENNYSNTPSAAAFLSKHSPKYLGYIIMHHHHLVESWSRLDEAVRSGQPITPRAGYTEESRRENFLMGMFNMAMELAPRIVPQIDLTGRKHLLDMGGGPGTYAIFFCQNNPDLRATVYDLPTTRPFAEKTIKQFDLDKRIDFQDGNYVTEEIQGEYDVVWLSHILHGENPETCQEMIRKAVSVLEPGGMILVHDFILDDTMDGPLFPALFSLNMLTVTPGGQSYSESQITTMLTAAGIKEVHLIALSGKENSRILSGTK